MIITKESEFDVKDIIEDVLPDVPPPYVQRATVVVPGSSEPAFLPPTPPPSSTPDFATSLTQIPDLPPSNFVHIFKRDGAIRQNFVIDTSLDVPNDLSTLPSPLAPGAKAKISKKKTNKDDPFYVDENAPRPHLKLESKDGSINTSIWLVHAGLGSDPPSQSDSDRGRAILDVGTKDGSVNVKLHSPTDQAVSLRVWSKDGPITVYVPSSFVGPVNIYTGDGSVVPSSGISRRLVTFSQMNKTRKCFLGDFKSAGYTDGSSWKGSTLDIMAKDGSVRLNCIEEYDPTKSKGFMGKILGAILNT